MDAMILAVSIISLAVSTVFGYVIGDAKKRPGLGTALGFFLGPIGVIVIAVLDAPEPPRRETRPQPPIDYARQSQMDDQVSEWLR